MAQFEETKRAFKVFDRVPVFWTREAITAGLNWFKAVGDDYRAIQELHRMSERELADIGLSRSDLSMEGLTIAGSKRAFKQDVVAEEIAAKSKKHE